MHLQHRHCAGTDVGVGQHTHVHAVALQHLAEQSINVIGALYASQLEEGFAEEREEAPGGVGQGRGGRFIYRLFTGIRGQQSKGL